MPYRVYIYPNPDKPEPKFCHSGQDFVMKCLILPQKLHTALSVKKNALLSCML